MEWTRLPVNSVDASRRDLLLRTRPIDPYLLWHDAIAFRTVRLGDGQKAVVQIELLDPLAGQLQMVEGLEVPPVYHVPLGSTGETTRFVTARVPIATVWDLVDDPAIIRVQLELARLGALASNAPASREVERPRGRATSEPLRLPATWLGLIDEGCPFGHAHFRDTGGASRVRLLWDPSGVTSAEAHPPKLLGYGIEWRPADLGAIAQADEGASYQALGLGAFSQRRTTHGCGVMDLLAGQPDPVPTQLDVSARVTDRAGGLPIACVLLPADSIEEGCRTGFGARVLDGLRYLVDAVERDAQADRARDPDVRLVVNLSYGSLAGPHDGTSILECAMDELIESRGNLAIVLAAGNTIDLDRPTHAMLVDNGKIVQPLLHWRVQPDDRTDSFVEIWFDDKVELDRVTLHVTAPGGSQRTTVKVGGAAALVRQGRPVAGLVFPRQCANGRHGTMALLALVPTDPTDGPAGAPGGSWTIELEYEGKAGSVHAWIERDDLVPGLQRQRQQSWFESANQSGERFEYTLSSIAHGRHTIVVGGMLLSDGTPPEYSASGPARAPSARRGPDISAPSDRSLMMPGMRVAGTLTGITQSFSGTSAAAPIAARWIANWMASRPPGRIGPLELRRFLAGHRRTLNAPGEKALRLSDVSFGPGGAPPAQAGAEAA